MEPRAKNDEFANGFAKFLSSGAYPAKTVEGSHEPTSMVVWTM